MTALATAADTANAPVPFAFESHQIRTIVNGDGIPWFVAKDVTTALGLVWNSRTLGSIPDEWKRLVKMSTLGLCEEKTSHPKRGGLRGGITAISEPAVYKLAFRSNKPEADRFTNWVASEVIPALRRQGKYELCPTRDASRLTTAKERNALTGLVNRYVGLLPGGPNQEAYKAAWRKVHDVMGITAIEDLTVEQLPRAVMFVQSLVDSLGENAAKAKALATVAAPTEIDALAERMYWKLRDAADDLTRVVNLLRRSIPSDVLWPVVQAVEDSTRKNFDALHYLAKFLPKVGA